MKKTELKVTRYEIDENFMVDVEIIESQNLVYFWLSHKDYAIKAFMFGLNKEDAPESEWADLINNNIYTYMYFYMQDREKEEIDN